MKKEVNIIKWNTYLVILFLELSDDVQSAIINIPSCLKIPISGAYFYGEWIPFIKLYNVNILWGWDSSEASSFFNHWRSYFEEISL